MARLKLADSVYRYNNMTRALECPPISEYLDTVPYACWPHGAAPKWAREGCKILTCRPNGSVYVLREWESEEFAESVLEDMFVESILDGPHFDAHLTASDALDVPCYDALGGPREQVVAELLRLERMGSGLAAEWLVETADMSDAEFHSWTERE